jgi:hypothetical protein
MLHTRRGRPQALRIWYAVFEKNKVPQYHAIKTVVHALYKLRAGVGSW